MTGNVRQLELIREVVEVAVSSGIDLWLRGGWAMDFFAGRITREHEDIDLFIWALDADDLVELLSRRGYEEMGGPPPERQRNLRHDGIDFHVTLLEKTPSGGVRTASAPPEWDDWPTGMLDAAPGRIGTTTVPIISPKAQIEIKRRFREFRPERPNTRRMWLTSRSSRQPCALPARRSPAARPQRPHRTSEKGVSARLMLS